MSQNHEKKPALYNEINELLSEFGESMGTASENSLFRQRVAKEILNIFSPQVRQHLPWTLPELSYRAFRKAP